MIKQLNTPPVASVIVPVYNRRDVIRRAVGSLLSQDFPHPFEVVVVDDGSTDGSADVVAGIDPRVRVIRQHNQGAAAARHRGIAEAKGGVVCFLDSDDIAKPFLLSALWRGLHRCPGVVLSYARAEGLDGQPFPIERLPTDLDEKGVLRDPLRALLEVGCFTTSMNLMTRRDVAFACSKGRQHFVASNDYDFTLRAGLHGPFAFVNEFTLCCDRGRPDGISRSKGALQVGFAILAAHQAVLLSQREDRAVWEALRNQVERLLPSALAQLGFAGYWGLCWRVALVGLRRTRSLRTVRRLWWALEGLRQTRANPVA